MKSNIRIIVAVLLVVVFCAAAAVTGFAVSAASQSHIAVHGDSNGTSAPAALKGGVWHAVYQNGEDQLFFIDSSDRSFALIDSELGIGLPSRYEYDTELGIYKMQIAYEGNEENWVVIDNSDRTATVCDETGDVITLYYIASGTVNDFSYYTLSELREAARLRFEEQNGVLDGVVYSAGMRDDGSFSADIYISESGKTVAHYTVDMLTAKGADENGEAIDLSVNRN